VICSVAADGAGELLDAAGVRFEPCATGDGALIAPLALLPLLDGTVAGAVPFVPVFSAPGGGTVDQIEKKSKE